MNAIILPELMFMPKRNGRKRSSIGFIAQRTIWPTITSLGSLGDDDKCVSMGKRHTRCIVHCAQISTTLQLHHNQTFLTSYLLQQIANNCEKLNLGS